MKQNQHQVVFVLQDSDGISLESELLSSYYQNAYDQENLQYLPFPEVEFRFDADDEPNDTDLENIREMYQKLIDNGNCWCDNDGHVVILFKKNFLWFKKKKRKKT